MNLQTIGKLMEIKEFLDSGILTQEEFDSEKKENLKFITIWNSV